MTEIDRQIALCDVLRYREGGDFAALRRAVELAGFSAELTDRFFIHNLILAMSFSGMIDVRTSGDNFVWWSRVHLSSRVPGPIAKIIPRSRLEVAESDRKLSPLITDAAGKALVLGTSIQREGEMPSSDGWMERIPRFPDIEAALCEPTPWPMELDGEVEIYDFACFRWTRVRNLESPAMVRLAGRFAGFRHFVGFPKLRLCFRLAIPEWSSFAAVNLLGSLVTPRICASGSACSINRTLRIPTLIGRMLFTSCEQVIVGSQLKFLNIDSNAVNALQAFFAPGKSHAAA